MKIRCAASVLALSLLQSCVTTKTATTTPENQSPFGIAPAEEAVVLRLEDRREFDPSIASDWLHRENMLHRQRMALALGRIETATFDDRNGNGVKDDGERMAGVDLLLPLASDPEPPVRMTVAFALGEIGDPAAVDTLFTLASDAADARVAAEAVEALSKLAPSVPVDRYLKLTDASVVEGVRAVAIRYLFRFDKPEATARAAAILEEQIPVFRREAAYSLSRRKGEIARARLELLLTDPDALTRSYAAAALGRIADPASLAPVMSAASRDQHPWVRTNAVRAVGQIAEKSGDAFRSWVSPEAVVQVVTLTSDADAAVRASATETLGWFAPLNESARAKLLDLAANASPSLREIATIAVARQLAAAEGSPLEPLLETDSAWIKARVIDATSAASLGKSLRARFAGESSAMVRASVVGAVPEDKVDDELDLVRRALDDSDTVVRATAVEKISHAKTIPQAEMIDLLTAAEKRGRTDADLDDVRLAAVGALAAIDYPGREPFLRSLLSDNDPVVRRAAANAIHDSLKMPLPQFTPLPVDRGAEYLAIARWAQQPHRATIQTRRGAIEVQLLSDDAPMTAWNYASLARKGYFDHNTFMRVVPNFVVQTGDPRNDQNGGPGYSIRDEINMQKYTRGAVGMALSGPDTGGSQYFITHSAQPHLDGGYTIFGRVTSGMSEVVDKIERGDEILNVSVDRGAAMPSEADASKTRARWWRRVLR